MSGERVQTQVLVVGAGPAGLLLAAELERRGVSCLLIDLLDAPQPWDRATVVHPRSMEIFEALGLAEQMLERGVRTRAARFRSQGEVLGELDLTSTGSRYDFDLGVSEEVTTQWAVFDATVDDWSDDYDVAAAFLETPPVILTPLPDRRWRVYLRPTSDDGDLVADAERVLHAYKPAASFAEIENPARFHCHSRVAAAFRSGRVLLAGDAAHVCSPAEGHGMNTGLQDAFNLGWKLALVCRGEADPVLLDSYEAERRPVALRVVESGSDAEGGQATTEPSERAARDAVIRRTYGDPESAHHEAAGAAELDRSYAGSPIVVGDASDRLPPGVRLPDTAAVEPAGAPPSTLAELTRGPGHTLLVLGGREADPEQVSGLAAELETADSGSPLLDAVVPLAVRSTPGTGPVGRLDAAAADELGIVGVTVLAIRPDRYVGLRHDGGSPEAIKAYLTALTAAG